MWEGTRGWGYVWEGTGQSTITRQAPAGQKVMPCNVTPHALQAERGWGHPACQLTADPEAKGLRPAVNLAQPRQHFLAEPVVQPGGQEAGMHLWQGGCGRACHTGRSR